MTKNCTMNEEKNKFAKKYANKAAARNPTWEMTTNGCLKDTSLQRADYLSARKVKTDECVCSPKPTFPSKC